MKKKRLKLTCVLSFAVASTLFNLSDLNISYANQNNIQETNLVEKNSEDKFIQELIGIKQRYQISKVLMFGF
ncbi:TPA: hypothetical protein ACIO1Z_001149 [Streptococcus agalactiae]